jgi:hypothetical protein
VLVLTDKGHKITHEMHGQFEEYIPKKLNVLKKEELEKLFSPIYIYNTFSL